MGMFFVIIRYFTDLCVLWIVSTDLMGYLSDLISAYLSSFRECYPHLNIIPKQHYMIHLPKHILKYVC